ncbi:MAG: hypothetical protein GY781_17725 [Gammaproteobacteria bacterium]|nr:hypothetical protein [Gammaproteobacteria bacterium]
MKNENNHNKSMDTMKEGRGKKGKKEDKGRRERKGKRLTMLNINIYT